MSIPPEFVQIKVRRKRRASEAPGQFLRVESSKRHRTDDYVYQRKSVPAKTPPATSDEKKLKPVIYASQPGDEKRPFRPIKSLKKSSRASSRSSLRSDTQAKPNNGPAATTTSTAPVTLKAPGEPERRFFLKRTRDEHSQSRHVAGAVFVEQGIKRRRSVAETEDDAHTKPTSVDIQITEELDGAPPNVVPPEPRRFKKPGLSRLSKPAAPRPLPPSMQHQKAPELTKDLEDWAVCVAKELKNSKSPPPKFKPRPVEKRFAERNPGYINSIKNVAAQHDKDTYMADLSDSDSDYITETWVRVPASAVQADSSECIGALVLATDADDELFYGNEYDTEEEVDDDGFDSNDENCYMNEYPDDDSSWSDEVEGSGRRGADHAFGVWDQVDSEDGSEGYIMEGDIGSDM